MKTVNYILCGSLIFHGLISSDPVVNGEKCLSCNEVIEPRHCNVAVECSQDEHCFTQKYRDISGEILYNVGCMDNRTCATSIGNSAPVQTYNGQLQLNTHRVSCQQCCKGTACNVNGCNANAYPIDKGLLCFQCKQHRGAGNCLTFEECFGIGARCFVEAFEEYGDKFFRHGCSTSKHCSSSIETGKSPSNIFGKKRQVKSVRLLNRTCCDSDFCNDGKDISSHKDTDQLVVNHYGKEFFLSFPGSPNSTNKIEILLTGMENATVTFESRVVGVNRTVVVPADKGLSVFLPLGVIYYSNITAITENTVKVVSNENLSVFVILYQYGIKSDGYLSIPKQTLRNSYIFILLSNGRLAITATNDNTFITINLRSTGDNSSKIYTYTISSLQTLYIYSADEVTGLVEASSNVVVVEVGAKGYQYIKGVLPLQSRSSFVLVPIQFNTYFASTVCIVKPNESNISKVYFSRQPNYDTDRSYFTFDFQPANDSYYPAPVIASRNGTMDCFIVAPGRSIASLPSLSSFSNNYLFKTPTSTSFTHRASIITPKRFEDGILDNGKALTIKDSTEINYLNQVYQVIALNISPGKHRIAHPDPDAKFGLILYGYNSSGNSTFISYAYPAGFERHPS